MMKKEILIFQNGAHFLSVFLKMSLVTVGKPTSRRGNEGGMAGESVDSQPASLTCMQSRAEEQRRKQECWSFPVMIV